MLFDFKNVPTSADGIQFIDNDIKLIEFKSGFKQKITKKNFDEEIAKCDSTNKICEEYWNLFWENQKRKIDELISSVRLKAIESYITLEKHIFPKCDEFGANHTSKLVFMVVVDEEGIDGFEDALAELSGSDLKTDNNLFSIKKSLKRLSNNKDWLGNTYLYDSIEVLTAQDFKNRIEDTIKF